MTKTELLELIRNGESSFVELKRDDIDNRALAKELVAFSNFEGGRVLLGVEDDHSISGIIRANLEEWVMTACRDKIRPPIIPTYEVIRDVETGKDVVVVSVQPEWIVHHVWHNNHAYYYIRVGTLSREVDTAELQRLFQRRGSVRFETQPVTGSTIAELSRPRLTEYFATIRGQVLPETNDVDGWERLLLNTEILAESGTDGVHACSVAGLLLFGASHKRFLPHATIDIAVFPGTEKEYNANFRDTANSPLVRLCNEQGDIVSPEMVDQALSMLQPHLSTEVLEGAARTRKWDYPKAALRAALVNAVLLSFIFLFFLYVYYLSQRHREHRE
ncbi:MAG: RNA-binding domain-containing protein [Kiritimatiellia bacterium]